jgi:hypothetical protein
MAANSKDVKILILKEKFGQALRSPGRWEGGFTAKEKELGSGVPSWFFRERNP